MPEDGEMLAADQPQELPPVNPEYNNLATSLDEEELREIANKCIEDFEHDLRSRDEWEAKHAKWLKLYYQEDMSDNPPWQGSSQESLPVLAEAVNQFQSRSYKAFFPNRYFIDAIPVGQGNPDARERAERVGRHMSYQLGVLDRTYKLNKSQMFLSVAIHGSDFTKTYFSPIQGRVVIERVRVQDLVVPYGVGPRRLEDVERKTHINWFSVNKTKVLHSSGWFADEGTAYENGTDDKVQEVVDDAEGIRKNEIQLQSDKPCCILEQHTLLDLDNDGIAEPYIVWIDRNSRKILRLQIRYEVDETGMPLNNKEPIEYFTHYQFLPNPDGFYGLGFGFLLGNMNKALNKLQRMFIDANELATVGNLTSLVSEALGLPGDEFELSMGRVHKIPRAVDDIKNHFMQMKFPGPTQETLQMIQQIQTHADRLGSNSDVLAGQPDKVYQPTAMLAMIEQGLQLFSSVQEILGHSMEDELQKVFRLNAKYLEHDVYFRWGDDQIQVTKEDYQDDFRVVPVFDPKYSTRSQKLAKAEATYNFIIQNPMTMQNGQSIYLASKAYLEALDTEDIDLILPQPPQQQPTRIDDQTLENTYFMMPPANRPLFDVFPDQDHIRHIESIDKLINWLDQAQPLMVPNLPGGDPQLSQLLAKMTNEQKEELIANLLRHRSLHVAYMFGQLNGVMDEQGNPVQQGQTAGQGLADGMAGQPDNGADMGALMQALQAATGHTDMPDGEGGVLSGTSGNA